MDWIFSFVYLIREGSRALFQNFSHCLTSKIYLLITHSRNTVFLGLGEEDCFFIFRLTLEKTCFCPVVCGVHDDVIIITVAAVVVIIVVKIILFLWRFVFVNRNPSVILPVRVFPRPMAESVNVETTSAILGISKRFHALQTYFWFPFTSLGHSCYHNTLILDNNYHSRNYSTAGNSFHMTRCRVRLHSRLLTFDFVFHIRNFERISFDFFCLCVILIFILFFIIFLTFIYILFYLLHIW